MRGPVPPADPPANHRRHGAAHSLWGLHRRDPTTARRTPGQWHLLTTLPVNDTDADAAMVRLLPPALARRGVLPRSQVRVQGRDTRIPAANRLRRAITIKAVIVWRIMLMTPLGGQVPNCDAGLMFSDHELLFLRKDARHPIPRLCSGVTTVPDHLGIRADSCQNSTTKNA